MPTTASAPAKLAEASKLSAMPSVVAVAPSATSRRAPRTRDGGETVELTRPSLVQAVRGMAQILG